MTQNIPPSDVPALRTPLHALHVSLGAKMAPFAGYDMPINYPTGVLAEHLHTRTAAGLFDVSHMGQAFLIGPDHETVARAIEALCPADIRELRAGQTRYTQLLNADGGIVDDLMLTRSADPSEDGALMLIVNAAGKERDFDLIAARIPANTRLVRAGHRALIALQGPKAAAVLARHCAGVTEMGFMTAQSLKFDGLGCHVSRSGYTGEDGYEISIGADRVERLARALLAEPEVQPIGLGARDSLRLEAGLCLYGHDIDESTSPVEAALTWSIGKRRRVEGGFPGAVRVQRELAQGATRLRVGLSPEGRAPAREGTEITDASGARIGIVTSGGFGPTLNGPLAMGYIDAARATPGEPVMLVVRGKPLPARVAPLPFVPHRYYRAPRAVAPVAVILEVWPATDKRDDYLALVASLRDEMTKAEGFLSSDGFESLHEEGKVLSLQFWRDEASIKAWRERFDDRQAQHDGVFRDYRLRIARVISDDHMDDRASATADPSPVHG